MKGFQENKCDLYKKNNLYLLFIYFLILAFIVAVCSQNLVKVVGPLEGELLACGDQNCD